MVLTTAYQIARGVVEFFYFIGGIVMSVAAVIALKQISIARADIVIRSKREAASVAAMQCERFAEVVVPAWSHMVTGMSKIGVPSYDGPVTGFRQEDLSELYSDWVKKWDDAKQKIGDGTTPYDVLNKLEALAIYFTKGIADEEIAFQSVGATFCQIVNDYYPLLLTSYLQSGYYKHVVELYQLWSSRLQMTALSGQLEEVIKKMATVETRSVSPLGTNM